MKKISDSVFCLFCNDEQCKSLQCLRENQYKELDSFCNYCCINLKIDCIHPISKSTKNCLNNAYSGTKGQFLIDDCHNCCMASHDNNTCSSQLNYLSLCLLFYGSFVIHGSETKEEKKKMITMIGQAFIKQTTKRNALIYFYKVKSAAVEFLSKLLDQ